MAFMLGSFMDGLLGGAKSVATIYGAYQGIARTNARMDRANQEADDLKAINQLPSSQPTQETAPQVQTDTPTDLSSQPDTGGPVAPDYTQLPLPPRPEAPAPTTPTPAPAAPAAPTAPVAATPPTALQVSAPAAPAAPLPVATPPAMGGMHSSLLTSSPAAPVVQAPAQIPNPDAPGPVAGLISRAWQGINSLGTGTAPTTPATPAAPAPAPASSAPTKTASLGSWLADTLNPVSSAQASEPTPGQSVEPPPSAPTPAAPDQGPPGQGLDTTMARLRSAQTPAAPAPAAPQGTTTVGKTAPTQALTPKSQPTGVTATPDKVAPSQQGPTVASQPPAPAHPQLDQRPYRQLAQHAPQYRELVDKIAAKYNVDPARLALHWGIESGLRTTAPVGKAGEIGPLQIMPATAARYDPNHTLDPAKLPDALELAARDIAFNDSHFGRDTPSSVVAYNAGTQGTEAMLQGQPNAMAENYLDRAFPHGDGHLGLTPPLGVNTQAVVQATLQQGPVGGLRALWATAPKNASSEDLFNNLETNLVRDALEKGDYAGAQHARDFVLQLMHGGAVASTMHAYQAMQAGNGVAAARYLAQAHAFVPDGMVGEFGVDKTGAVFGRMKDERSGKPVGGFFQVTPDKLLPLLMDTRDPIKFMQMVSTQQQAASKARLDNARVGYLQELVPSREREAQQKNQTALQVAELAADSRKEAAAIRANKASDGSLKPTQIAAEISRSEPLKELQATDARAAGYAGQAYSDIRAHDPSIAPPMAAHIATGLVQGQYKMVADANGQRYGVVDPRTGKAVVYLSPATAQMMTGFLSPAKPAAAAPTARAPSSALPLGG